MAHWLTVLIAVLAQGITLMSPVCLIRCVGADGHECVELVGQGCHRCGCEDCEPSPQVCAVATCCPRENKDEDAPQSSDGWQVRGDDCSCLHSPMKSAPQVRSKSLSSETVSSWQQVLLAPVMLSLGNDLGSLKEVGLLPPLFRPDGSPHLAIVATKVLRV